jgi:hypothetical protein
VLVLQPEESQCEFVEFRGRVLGAILNGHVLRVGSASDVIAQARNESRRGDVKGHAVLFVMHRLVFRDSRAAGHTVPEDGPRHKAPTLLAVVE